jgi:pimeloyl-ACP methyl ester carboxylesterase
MVPISASTIINLTIEAALVVACAFAVADVTGGTNLKHETLWFLLLANIAVSGSRLLWTGIYAAAQLRAVRSSLLGQGRYETPLKSLYAVMCAMRAVGLLLNAAEIGIAIALSIFYRRDSGSLPLAIVLTRWVAVLIYLFLAPAEPLHWPALLVGGSAQAVKSVFFDRIHTMIRVLLCCVCEPSFPVSRLGKHGEPEATTVAAILSMVAVELLGGGQEKPSLLRVVAGLQILSRASSDTDLAPEGSPLSHEQVTRCHTAVQLHNFAVGVYTGVLMDCGRLPLLGCCCWARNQCCGCDGRGDRFDDDTFTGAESAAGVHGDNCWHGHHASFRRYVGPSNSSCLLAARLNKKPGEVCFFVVQRHAEITGECPRTSEIIVAIRGSQEVIDGITDGLLLPERLTPTDLGLVTSAGVGGASTMDIGYAFTGVLACARALADELLPILSVALRASPPSSTTVYIVGHSLGGSTAALLALRLGPVLRELGAASVSAVCYNPMPTLSPAAIAAVGPRGTADVLSLVFRDDFASRLSFNRLVGLRDRAMAAADGAGDCSNMLRAIRIASSLVTRCLLGAGAYAPWVEHAGRACTARTGEGKVGESPQDDRLQSAPLLSGGSAVEAPPTTPPALSTSPQPHPSSAARDAAVTDAAQVVVEVAEGHGDDDELYLAGQVVHVRGSPGKMQLVAVSTYAFPSLTPTPTFFLDHVPWMLQFELATSLGVTFAP